MSRAKALLDEGLKSKAKWLTKTVGSVEASLKSLKQEIADEDTNGLKASMGSIKASINDISNVVDKL